MAAKIKSLKETGCNSGFFFQENGAVTVFSVIVLSSLLLFFSLLIDYARIAVMHKLAEDAVRSGVRSVLSAYDSTLYERYGLFGRGGTEGQSIFSDALTANTDESARFTEPGMKLVRMKVDKAALHPASFLGSHEIFARQVLEEMKYKAPVDFTLELAAKFIPIAGAMKESSITISLLERMRMLYEQREAHLIRVLQGQELAAAAVRDSGIAAMIPVEASMGTIPADTALGIAGAYPDYAAIAAMQSQLSESEGNQEKTTQMEAYEESVRGFASTLKRGGRDVLQRHTKLQEDAFKELEAARMLNEQMQQLAREANQQATQGGYDAVSRMEVPGAVKHEVPADAASDLEQIRKTADELVLNDEWFAEYRQELEAQGSSAAAIDMETGSFQTSAMASLMKPVQIQSADTLLEGAASLRLAYGSYNEKYIQPAVIVASRRNALEHGEIKEKLKQQEKQSESLWKQARSLLHGLTAIPQTEEHQLVFEQIKQLYNANLLFNEKGKEASFPDTAGAAEGAHDASEQSAAFMDGLFSGMASMLADTRDDLFFGEYVLGRYASFAPQHLKAMLTGGDLSELSHAVSFNNQEAEYIIYGFHNPVGNIAAAYGELFAARLSVRTMEGLMESRTLGHPLLILSAALIYGLEKSIEDLIAFTERGSAPLSKYVKLELSYQDYLRLFILLHGANDSSSLARMIAVVEHNSGTILSAVPSGVTGEAELSAELWFVPGLMGALGNLGLLDGKVEGNRYETTQTIGWSY
ncbi:hypothetical protein FHS16_004966 [Paenibacillus endophyticus]|uniref:Uncharacterized protein n=1 Tax=Paenibacillus endophyticus TaxID=1294268 RepID=A0A7W5GC14_9BACL|nr:hypothetical protein [Paenibacillus endophyticus]MBB3154884.1 hypothetical protein [Paenibacillus endophyticus]